MGKIKLDELDLYTFDKGNLEHLEFLKRMISQKDIMSRFQGISKGLLHNYSDDTFFGRGFIVGDNLQLVAYLDIGNFNQKEKVIYLRCAVDNLQRGNKYSSKILDEVCEYIFSNNEEVEKIKLKIADDNKSSLKRVRDCGFNWEVNDIYYKDNPYIFNKNNK